LLMVTDPRQIRRLGSGFSQVDSVFHKNYAAGCVHGVRTRLTFFWRKRNRPGTYLGKPRTQTSDFT